jgi:small subunit ribosomal protein S18
MKKLYELYLIVRSDMDATAKHTELDRIASILESDVSAKNIEVIDEGNKKLAYPIQKLNVGTYVSIRFEVEYADAKNMQLVEKKLNISEPVLRYILTQETQNIHRKSKESLNTSPTATTHQELNKGSKNKKDLASHLGMAVVDYKDVEFLQQFISPYSKIFARKRTGNSALSQRKIAQAIKRARHMGLIAFTPKHQRTV